MRTLTAILVATIAISVSACGATRSNGTIQPGVPSLTSAVVTFMTRDHGKDAKSAVAAELLRNNSELTAEARTVGTKYDDRTTSAPISMAVVAPFTRSDADNSRLRIRMTPDGQDDWYTDIRLVMTFSDGSAQTYMWNDVRLDNGTPERILSLNGARIP